MKLTFNNGFNLKIKRDRQQLFMAFPNMEKLSLLAK